jgi:hypothetical protein
MLPWWKHGGERTTSTSQFPRGAEPNFLMPGANPTPGIVATPRAAAPVAGQSAAPNFNVPEPAAFAPVQAALERFASRPQETLAMTVRFEQGGSLSLRLSHGEGGIKTHIQTDVPGLEAALRSGWDNFAQDWSHRGVRLGALSFSNPSTSSGGEHAAGREGSQHHAAGQHGQDADGSPRGFAWSGARRSSAPAGDRAVGHRSVSGEGAAATSRLSGRLPRGFRTWA